MPLLNIYLQQNEDTELRSQAKKRRMAARNFRAFGTDNSGKFTFPKKGCQSKSGMEIVLLFFAKNS